VRPWIKYTLVRVIIFAVILAVLLLVGVPTILAAVIAALGGLGISFLFFRKLRDEVALEMANRRKTPAPRKDDEEEDALDENQRAE
jgi:membrane associated rhomboid family serine protease